jgi:phytoene desaturase
VVANSNPKIVIVGAGPGGLAAAILLSHAGADVTVLERQNRVGGRTASLREQGFRFDIGATFFLYPRVLAEIYEQVGLDLWSEIPMRKLDPHYKLVFGGGGELVATCDIGRLEAAVAKLCPDDAANVRRYLAENREKLERFRPCLETAFTGWRDIATPQLMRLLPLLRPWSSLDGELCRYFRDPRVRIAFSFQSKYLGMSPFRCPSLFSILAYLEYDSGVFHPIGGCGAVSENMAEVATRLGAKIRLSEAVEAIDFAGRRATGVRTSRRHYPADALVINADFARAMKRLVPDSLRSRWTDASISRKRFSCSTFMLYLGIEGCYDKVPHHTVYIPREYRSNLDDIERRHILSADPAVYVQNACVTDASLAPPGMSTLYVLVPAPHRHANINWAVERQRYRQVALRQLQKIGIQDVESRIRYERIVTPDDWDQDFEIHQGATFNLAHNLGQMLHLRPNNRFEDLQSVYLAGGGTHPGSGLPVIYESARISSKLILQDLSSQWRQLQTVPTRRALSQAS